MKIKKFLRCLSLLHALAALILTISFADAAVIATEDFAYGDGALAATNGGTGDWSGAWAGSGSVSGGQNLTATSSFGNRPINTDFSGSASAPLYFSALFTKTGTDTTYALWLQLSDNSTTNNRDAVIGLANDNFSLRLDGTTNQNGDFGTYSSGTQVQIVGKVEFNVIGVNERLSIWIDPSAEETAAATNSITGSDLGWVSPAFAITGNFVLSGGDGLIDDIKIGSKWSDVAIPEPSAAMLLIVGGLSTFLRRRR